MLMEMLFNACAVEEVREGVTSGLLILESVHSIVLQFDYEEMLMEEELLVCYGKHVSKS